MLCRDIIIIMNCHKQKDIDDLKRKIVRQSGRLFHPFCLLLCVNSKVYSVMNLIRPAVSTIVIPLTIRSLKQRFERLSTFHMVPPLSNSVFIHIYSYDLQPLERLEGLITG